jgi:hypothetical protein
MGWLCRVPLYQVPLISAAWACERKVVCLLKALRQQCLCWEARIISPPSTLAREQERRIDVLLACPGRFLGMFGRWPRHFKQAEVQFPWWPDVADPEFRKNLRIFRRLVSDASALCCRVGCQSPSNSRLQRSSSGVACRIGELEQRIQLPKDRWLTLEVLLSVDSL